jgi:hypothetical protein
MEPTRFKHRRIHITLIRPPVLELRANLSSYGAIPPIGLAYIAAVLRDADHQITVIDAPGARGDRRPHRSADRSDRHHPHVSARVADHQGNL